MASSILQSIFCRMKMSNTEPPPRKLSPPCLILPSSYEVGYKKLYSLAEKKAVSIEEAPPPPAWAQGGRVKHVGCSHGWVASFNEDNRQTFLFDPITGCHVRLPDIDHTLPAHPPPFGARPINIILSSSPDARDCRAIMRYAPPSRIAVCSPAHSGASWLPVCGQGPGHALGYSTRQNRLFSLTNKPDSDLELECWDLEHPSSFVWKAQIHTTHGYEDEHYFCPRYLVIDEHSDRLFLVIRVISEEGGEDEDKVEDPLLFCKLCGNYKGHYCRCGNYKGDEVRCKFLDSYCTCPRLQNWSEYMVNQALLEIYITEKRIAKEEKKKKKEDEDGDILEEEDEEEEEEEEEDGDIFSDYSHKTLGFHVYEIDRKKGEMRYMEASLDGLAMFVGSNYSFAMPAADLNLNPDSIYFTDDGVNYISEHGRNDDVGIFNYVDSKITTIDYDLSQTSTTSSRIAPAMWFTPIPQ
ncbi:hypothetical protein AAHA92_04417 [Salvia divinorum]|uniref:KIB1-4 beta-propeller domain-containing protein n=1 Tax=Salvia divinorum TaxID=28513 RepID=A0ABD1I009_SALDI